MKILIVIDTLASGGAQKLKLELAKGLTNKGHEVEIFIYDSNYQFFESDFIDAGIKIHIANRHSPGFSFRVLRELRYLIRTQEYDGVISSLHAPSIYSAFSILGVRRTKLIVCEESSSKAPIPLIKKILFYLSTIIADHAVANSYSEAEEMRKIPGRQKKIHTIWNGFDLESIPFNPKIFTKEENIENLLVVGRVAYPKNGLNIMKGLEIFLSRNGWMPELNWIGRRDSDTRSAKDLRSSKLQNEMDEYLKCHPNVASKWNWLGNVDDIFKYYKDADALIAVSLYEGLPVVICEAMLSGCFVIASDVCDHPRLIGEELRGILCDPNSPESVCYAIEKFNKMNSSQKNKIVNKARYFAENNFKIEEMVNAYESLLTQ